MKTISLIWRAFLFTGALTCLGVLNAHAQATGAVTSQVTPTSTATAPAKPIGPAPANSAQHQILSTALSPQTRQTLQQAMNSYQTK